MKKIRKPRVLLTGFTPFGGETVNPALKAVCLLYTSPSPRD